MTWKPIDHRELHAIVERDLAACSAQQRSFFASIAIEPEKWRHSVLGAEGGGFWAIAIHDKRVLWFNDIEDGFNISTFEVRGELPENEYWCNQDSLQCALLRLLVPTGNKS